MADHAGAGSAKRRRERRLRSWWRHERMSIACTLAEALHHSSGSPEYDRRRVGVAQHGAVRGQMTATRAGGPAHSTSPSTTRTCRPPRRGYCSALRCTSTRRLSTYQRFSGMNRRTRSCSPRSCTPRSRCSCRKFPQFLLPLQ